MSTTNDVTDWERVEALLLDDGKGKTINEDDMRAHLKSRVVGQDHVVDDLVTLIAQKWQKDERRKPICNVLFLGHTGTGKTELTKAMTEFLFEDEKNVLNFDSSALGPNGKEFLLGMPKGYVDAASGGRLTRPMLAKKERLIVFDEIEKAHPSVCDLFLPMFDEGRLVEPFSNKTVDFTQSIIVLTSNAEADALVKIQEQVTEPQEQVNAIMSHLADAQVFRPEIVSRLNRIYVFKPLEAKVSARIIGMKIARLAAEYGLELVHIDPALVVDTFRKGQKVKSFGVRALEDIIQDQYGAAFIAAKEAKIKRIRVDVGETGRPRAFAANRDAIARQADELAGVCHGGQS